MQGTFAGRIPSTLPSTSFALTVKYFCQRETHHLAWLDNFFEHSMGRETRLTRERERERERGDFANKKVAAFGYQVGLSSACIHAHSTEPSIGWRVGDDIFYAGEEKFVDEIFDKSKGEMILKKRAQLGFAVDAVFISL